MISQSQGLWCTHDNGDSILSRVQCRVLAFPVNWFLRQNLESLVARVAMRNFLGQVGHWRIILIVNWYRRDQTTVGYTIHLAGDPEQEKRGDRLLRARKEGNKQRCMGWLSALSPCLYFSFLPYLFVAMFSCRSNRNGTRTIFLTDL